MASNPVPVRAPFREALPRPVPDGDHGVLQKRVKNPMLMGQFKESVLIVEVMKFITEANVAIRGTKTSDERELSDKIKIVCDFLKTAEGWVAEIPPIKQSMRFGNKAFRTWHERLVKESAALHTSLLKGTEYEDKQQELVGYFKEAFGSAQRIDYGTGHELCFVTWLAALRKIGIFGDADMSCLVLDVFCAYLAVMRVLQTVYWLEPAGSKGVWGLDDYQFLPLLWGAGQLSGQQNYEPGCITDADLMAAQAKDYLYFAAIAFVNKVKTGPFHEHSPMLHDISAVPNWAKVNQGLFKMYDAEVLGKFPVVQHIYFGSILSFDKDPRAKEMMAAAKGVGRRPPRGQRIPPPTL